MKFISKICGVVLVICIFFIALISAIEIASYGDWGFYEKEYEKNHVLEAVDMEMDDLMHVTREMMAYLRGNRNDLVIETTIGGETKEFFNDREKYHMADCRVLFVGAVWLRRFAAILAMICCILPMLDPRYELLENAKRIVAFLWKGLLVFVICTGGLITVIASNFEKAFVKFHHIFFDNDMWLLNPKTDRLINIVPQGFFVDICVRIAVIFGILMIFIFVIAIISECVIIKKLRSKYNK